MRSGVGRVAHSASASLLALSSASLLALPPRWSAEAVVLTLRLLPQHQGEGNVAASELRRRRRWVGRQCTRKTHTLTP